MDVSSQWLLVAAVVLGVASLEFPNPQREFMACGRRNASFICDPDFILDRGDVEKLDLLAQEFQRSTSCLCSNCDDGISIGIFIKRNVSQLNNFQSSKRLAEAIRRRWRLGKCNDDIIILLLTGMNISDYSMGPAVQGIFPRKTADQIIRDCQIHFTYGLHYQGLESIVNSFNDVLLKIQQQRKMDSNLIIGMSLGIGVLLILLITAIVLLRRQTERRNRGCSDIYASVPTKNNGRFLDIKANEYQLEKFHKQDSSEDEEEDNEDCLPKMKYLKVRRQLSDVKEESETGSVKDSENQSFKETSQELKSSL